VLQCVAVWCSGVALVVQHVKVCDLLGAPLDGSKPTGQRVAVRCCVLQPIAACQSVCPPGGHLNGLKPTGRRDAACCSLLQPVAACQSMWPTLCAITGLEAHWSVRCSVLHCVAVYCSMLLCVAAVLHWCCSGVAVVLQRLKVCALLGAS